MTTNNDAAIKEIERGVNVVQLRLSWGSVEWRSSAATLQGTALDRLPFTIYDVKRHELLSWLKGASLKRAFPGMTAEHRALLLLGRTSEDTEDNALHTLATPPGATVLEYLEHRGWSQDQLALATGLQPKVIHAICNGVGVITPEIAALFESELQRPAHFWLNLQRLYNERAK